jgi:YidC/Oxa1 family membrane protein insertase
MFDKKTILAFVLALAVFGIYQVYVAKQQPQKQPAPAVQQAGQAQKESVNQSASQQKLVAAKIVIPKKQAVPKDIKVETPHYLAVFSTKGGALKSFRLKGYQQDCAECSDDIYPRIKRLFINTAETPKTKSKELVELVNVKNDMPYPLTVSFPQSSVDIPPDTVFEANVSKLDLLNTKEKKSLTFTQTYNNKIKVEKIFTFDSDNYTIGLDVKVINLTSEALTQTPQLSWLQYVDPRQETDSYGHDGPVISVARSIEQQDLKKISKEKSLGPNVLWGAYESKYFIASVIPPNPSLTNVTVVRDMNDVVSVNIKGLKEIIPGKQINNINYVLYLGPKDYETLKTLNVGLEDSIDFGSWLKWLAIPLLYVLNFLNQFAHNYGLAIIILTLLIKIIFWPLGNMSYKSMKEMQKIQPQIKELQNKYQNDKAKLSQETMAMYKAHKVNPFGGCLPMLIQIPVFFGLYKTLLYCIELRHSPFIWWLQDLSAKDPYYITPIIMGVTQFIQQKMTPSMGDPMQAKIMLFMPVIMTFFFLNFPSGLVIYWLFNNILGIGQQLYINKKLSK